MRENHADEQEKIIAKIESRFLANDKPIFVYATDACYVGYFQDFDDAKGLRELKSYRFVPLKNSSSLKEDYKKTGKWNLELTEIIDTSKIIDLRESMSKYGADALVKAAKNFSNRLVPATDNRIFKFTGVRLTITYRDKDNNVDKTIYDNVNSMPYGIAEIFDGYSPSSIYCIELDAILTEIVEDNREPEIHYTNLERLLSTFSGAVFDIRMT